MDVDWFNKNIKCCACGGTLEASELNVFVTEKLATWKSPVFGCFDIPDYGPRAVAIICDECLRKNTRVRYCIEWEGWHYKIKYHDIESLKDRNKSESQRKYYFGCCSIRPDKKESVFQENGGNLENVNKKRSEYQVMPTNLLANLLARCRQVPSPLRRLEDQKMKNPEYSRLMKDGRFVGFKRVVTEFLPASHNAWQLDPIEHDPDDTQKLSRPAVGTETLKREGITSST